MPAKPVVAERKSPSSIYSFDVDAREGLLLESPGASDVQGLRIRSRATKAMFAELLGVSISTVDSWELGRSICPRAAWTLMNLFTATHPSWALHVRPPSSPPR